MDMDVRIGSREEEGDGSVAEKAFRAVASRALDAALAGFALLLPMGQLLFPGEAQLLRGCRDPDATYVEQLMPRKLAADLEYERRRTLATDLVLMARIALQVLRPGRDEAVPDVARSQHA
jgi:hypothetical protein